MRLYLTIFFVGLWACSPDRDAANEEVALERNGQQIREMASKEGQAAEEGAAPAPGNAAPGTGRTSEIEADSLDATRAPPKESGAQGSSPGAQVREVAAPAAPAAAASSAQELVRMKCSTCHSLEVALAAPRSAKNWAEMVEAMTGHGMVVSETERRTIQNYLETCCSSASAP